MMNSPEILEALREPGSLVEVADNAVGFAAHEREFGWLAGDRDFERLVAGR